MRGTLLARQPNKPICIAAAPAGTCFRPRTGSGRMATKTANRPPEPSQADRSSATCALDRGRAGESAGDYRPQVRAGRPAGREGRLKNDALSAPSTGGAMIARLAINGVARVPCQGIRRNAPTGRGFPTRAHLRRSINVIDYMRAIAHSSAQF